MKLEEVKTGGKDQHGREILAVLWSTKDYMIYQHPEGISPHFSDDERTSTWTLHSHLEFSDGSTTDSKG